MKSIKTIQLQPKWYLSAALIFIAVLGIVLGQQRATVPNQEIVLQFSNADISSNEMQQTITILEQQLERIGVVYMDVSEYGDGKLVISYYSDSNVERIKELLSNQKDLALGFVSSNKDHYPLPLPAPRESTAYNLEVHEIHDGQNSVSELGGQSAVELKSGQYRFINPHFYIPSQNIFNEAFTPVIKIKVAIQTYSVTTKDNNLHHILEVRAGPIS